MKTMNIWRLAFAMLAAFSLASCSSDDDEVFQTEQLAGDTTFVRDYALTEDRHLAIYIGQYGGTPPEIQEYDVQRLSDKDMTWHLSGSDVVLNFKKVK